MVDKKAVKTWGTWQECYVRCSKCGKRVSNIVLSSLPKGLVVRAFVECPECIERKPKEPPIVIKKQLKPAIGKTLDGKSLNPIVQDADFE